MRVRLSALAGTLMLIAGIAAGTLTSAPVAAQSTGLHLGFPSPPIASAGAIPTGGTDTFILRSKNGTAIAPNTTVYVCQCLLVPNKPGASVPGDSTTVPATQCGGVSSLPTDASLLQCVTDPKGQLPLTYHTPAQTVAQGRADWVACLNTACGTKAITHYVYTTIYRFNPSPVAQPGSLAPGQTVTVTLSAKDGLNNPVVNATVDLSFKHASGGGSASVGGTNLTGTPQLFTTDSNGLLSITYTAPTPLPASGIDVITAKSTSSGAQAETNTDSYDFNPSDPVISVSDIQVVEGDKLPGIPAEFTVTISPPQPTATTFQYVTLCGIGDKGCGEDFTQVNSPVTVTIPAGANYAYCTTLSSQDCSTSAESQLDVKQFAYVGGNKGETYNEGWYVEIENPSAGVIGRSMADGLLLPDIEGVTQPLADLYTGNASAVPSGTDPADSNACTNGGNVPMFFTVTLGAPTKSTDTPKGTDVRFNYATSDGSATAGVDYVATSGTATISASYGSGGPGHQTSAIIPVCLLPGAATDVGKTFNLTISNPQGTTKYGNPSIPSIYQVGQGVILDPNAVSAWPN